MKNREAERLTTALVVEINSWVPLGPSLKPAIAERLQSLILEQVQSIVDVATADGIEQNGGVALIIETLCRVPTFARFWSDLHAAERDEISEQLLETFATEC